MEDNLQQQIIINYDLFITKISENGAILDYSLYEQNHNISIDNLARLIVTEDKDYCNYKVVNNELVELTEEEKQALIPAPTPTEQDKVNASLMLEIAKLKAKVGTV